MNSRHQIFAIARDLKWIASISVVVAALLYVPDQVSELYRLSAAQGNSVLLEELASIVSIAIVIWFGALLIAAESAKLIGVNNLRPAAAIFLRCTPMFLGVLPVLAATAAQLTSMPRTDQWTTEEAATLRQVGSVFRIEETAISDDVFVLWICFLALIGIAAVLLALSWYGGERLKPYLVKIDEAYFRHPPFLIATVTTIAVVTGTFVAWPDTPAHILGTFGIVAVFTLCITAFCVHISLLTIDRSLPFFPVIFLLALILAAIGTNDNHHIRTLDGPSDFRLSASQAFVKWMGQPERLSSVKSTDGLDNSYPVFIVSAEGGGIYAAYNAALFLARMQDLCPDFSRHLFAISSVSGGSVGAAVFTAALSSKASATTPSSTAGTARHVPCDDRIAKFVANLGSPNLDKPGTLEETVDRTLRTDFLSPLVAASLFPDFTQSFIPFPVGPFDRARALEYTLENAAADAAKGPAANLLKADYQSIWAPENGLPALLLNTTDAGSGKRVLIAPFDINPEHPKDDPLCMLANVQRSIDGTDVIASRSLHFPLSTAAFISARFPWVTPAATVDIANSCITQKTEARLVDGGYVDNSGVETAINLVEAINRDIAHRKADSNPVPKFRFYLISLSGGDFPDRTSFSFNELLEPIRALLNGRSSRAYIALNRAPESMKLADPAEVDSRLHFAPFTKTNLQNYFYSMPLGWVMSDKTREMVSISSGRFWDCEPTAEFSQGREFLSNADCIQMQVYHLLNGSVAQAVESQKAQVKINEEIDRQIATVSDQQPVHEAILSCYEDEWFHRHGFEEYQNQIRNLATSKEKNKVAPPPYRPTNLAYYQSEQVRALLSEWDHQKNADDKVLAYLLGSISYDSGDFVWTTENLSFSSAAQIEHLWKGTIDKIDRYRKSLTPPLPPVNTEMLVNNPVELANTMLGWPQNQLGNNQPNDGYTFRARGLYQIVGREQYDRENRALREFNADLKIDILGNPNSLASRRLSAKIALSHFFKSRQYRNKTLAEIIREFAPDWKKIRSLQNDMDQGAEAFQEIPARTDMFAKCIEEARNPKPSFFSWSEFLHLIDVVRKRFGHLI